MVHGDHNKNRSGGFFLIILGALIFITSPTLALQFIFGFIVGGLGFYMNFIRGREIQHRTSFCSIFSVLEFVFLD